MAQKKVRAAIVSQEKLAEGIFSMWLDAPEMAEASRPGQFIAVYTNDPSKLLPRPISICEADKEKGRLRIVYRIAGAGTLEFSRYQAGDTLDIMGPLGNGFPLKDKKAFLIGGGIGIPPMLELAKNLECEKTAVLGDRDAETFLADEIVCHDLEEEPMAAVACRSFFSDLPDGPLHLRDLKDKPIIFYRRYESLVMAAFRDEGIEPNVFCKNDDARTSLLWARAGLGIAIVPKSSARMIPGAELLTRSLAEKELYSRVSVIHRKHAPLSAAARSFLQFFCGEEE